MISFTCLWCSQQFTAPDTMAGKKVKCRNCGSPIDVPAPGAAAAPAPQAPAQAAAPAVFGNDPFGIMTSSSEEGEYRRSRGSTLPGMLVALVGVAFLTVGVFLPAFTFGGEVGKKTFWQIGTGVLTVDQIKSDQFDPGQYKIKDEHLSIGGAIVVFLAGIAFLAALARSSGMLWFLAFLVVGAAGYTFGRFYYLLHQMKTQPQTPPAGDFCLGVPMQLLPQARYEVGWIILGVGVLFMILGAIAISFVSRRRYR
jgi:hypothetical protein